MEKFEAIAAYWKRKNGPNANAPVVRCPDYWHCGDYSTMARDGSRAGKAEVRCAYHARQIEKREAQAVPS